MPERLLDASRGLLGDVLVERARHRARGEDALDGTMVEGTEGGCVSERGVDVDSAEALAQEQDLAGLRAPDARCSETHQPEEFRRALAHCLEGELDLIEIDRTLALRKRMEPGGIELQALTARSELVTRHAG
jgi:hypothetical protein